MFSRMWADPPGDKQRSSVSVPKTVRNRCFPMFLGPMRELFNPQVENLCSRVQQLEAERTSHFHCWTSVEIPIAFAVQNQAWKSMFRTLGMATRSTCSGFCLDLLECDGDGNIEGVPIGEQNMALLSVRKLVPQVLCSSAGLNFQETDLIISERLTYIWSESSPSAWGSRMPVQHLGLQEGLGLQHCCLNSSQ